MFKTILKTVALHRATMSKITVLSCGLFILTNCGTLVECLALGDGAADRPSCDGITGVNDFDSYDTFSIGDPIADVKGTATYDGHYSLYGSNRVHATKMSLEVNFDDKTIATNDTYNDSVNINGSFTAGGVLTGTFNIENDGIAAANMNGMIGHEAVWAIFDSRSETAVGYLGDFLAHRDTQYYPEPQPEGCYYCASLAESLELRKQRARRLELAHIADLALIGRPAHLEGEESRLAEEAYRAEILRINGEEYVSENLNLGAGYDAVGEAYLAEILRIEGEEIFTKNADLGDLYHLGGEGYRAAAEAYLAELSRVIEEEGYNAELARPEDNPELTRLYERRAEEYELDRERRIQAEFKEDTSAFNTTSAQAYSIYHKGSVSYDHGIEDVTRRKTQDTFGIRKNKGEEQVLIMTLNGVEYDMIPDIYEHSSAVHFGAVDAYESIYSNKENNTIHFKGNPNIQKIIRGTHATIQGDYVKYNTYVRGNTGADKFQTVDYTEGYATIGIQTPASVVDSQSAVATYKGTGRLDVDAKAGARYSWGATIGMTMNVDFDANTIAGAGQVYSSHETITFKSTPIVGNGFEGTFAFNRYTNDHLFDLNGNPTGQYSGNFFGPNADDLAGVMSFDGTAYDDFATRRGNIGVVGVGAFRADRQ